MKNKSTYSSLVILFLLLGSSYSQTLAPFATVQINNFTSHIWAENVSLYMVRSQGHLTLLPTPFQKIIHIKSKDNIYAALIACGNNSEYTQMPSEKDLKNTRLLQLNDPIIQQFAQKITCDANCISAVEQLVFDTITTKTEGIPIIPAPTVLQIKKGDCTEHAIATVAILRALKIPSRAVVGLILTKEYGGKKNVFVFHMWVESFYNNAWHLVDATRPGSKKSNHYIALAYHSLETEMPLEFLETMAHINNLTITYVSQ